MEGYRKDLRSLRKDFVKVMLGERRYNELVLLDPSLDMESLLE